MMHGWTNAARTPPGRPYWVSPSTGAVETGIVRTVTVIQKFSFQMTIARYAVLRWNVSSNDSDMRWGLVAA